jgi:hypothetical protein
MFFYWEAMISEGMVYCLASFIGKNVVLSRNFDQSMNERKIITLAYCEGNI